MAEHEAELLAENRSLIESMAEVAAKAWDEGLSAAYGHVYRQEDADSAGQGHLVPSPANPYAADARAVIALWQPRTMSREDNLRAHRAQQERCCHRSFVGLQQHIARQHPTFVEESEHA